MIKLIIFDFDDTLIDNQKLDYESFRNICLKFQAYIPTKNVLFKLRNKNYDAKEIIDIIIKKSNKKINKNLFFKKRSSFLSSPDSLNYLIIKPYVRRIIKKLFSQNYILLILSIRKKKFLIQNFLEKNDLSIYFENILNPENSKLEMRNISNAIKTKRQLFKKIFSLYDVKNNEVLYVGDSEIDSTVASIYGVKFILVKNPLMQNSIKSDQKIDTFKDLEFIVKQISNNVR